MKLTAERRELREHMLNKLDWFSKLAAANTRFGMTGARLKTEGCDPSAEIQLSAESLEFLVDAGRSILDGGRDGE